MEIAQLVSDQVDPHVRVKGDALFAQRRVRIVEGDAGCVEASVEDGRTRHCAAWLRPGELEVACTCAWIRRSGECCEHAWATILAANREGRLRGDGSRPLEHLELLS